jgi:eukaryotic-like serine/threonine-protein kinase
MRRVVQALQRWIAKPGAAPDSPERAATEPLVVDTQPPYAAATPFSTHSRFRIGDELAHGAMGRVFEATDLAMGRKVAVKRVDLPRGGDPDALREQRERFLREAEAARRLHHPGIVEVFDVGDDGPCLWMVMEFVQGHDLNRHTEAPHLLPLLDVLSIGVQVARALAFAHRQGIVHRDIKPGNVIYDVEAGQAKVADFGVAYLADLSQTRTGVVLGTPSYMPPEQIAGRRVDGRADLYALGVMLYQLLTGALPFRASGMGELLAAIARQPAPDPRALRPELPPALSDVLELALQKRPELRYASGDAMADDLQAVRTLLTRQGR